MLKKYFCLEDSCFVIKSEDNLIDIFDALVYQGVEPSKAYDLIVDKYGEAVISEFLSFTMAKEYFCLEDSSVVIKSEDNLIDIFDALFSQGTEPSNAYDLIVDKYGDDVISKFLKNGNPKIK
jgi:cytochrome c-type biogenesis protein CcmH/NrfF